MTPKQLAAAAVRDLLQVCIDTPPDDKRVTVDAPDLDTAARCAAVLNPIGVKAVVSDEAVALVLGTASRGFSWD